MMPMCNHLVQKPHQPGKQSCISYTHSWGSNSIHMRGEGGNLWQAKSSKNIIEAPWVILGSRHKIFLIRLDSNSRNLINFKKKPELQIIKLLRKEGIETKYQGLLWYPFCRITKGALSKTFIWLIIYNIHEHNREQLNETNKKTGWLTIMWLLRQYIRVQHQKKYCKL
jgi:hypothetical protein